MSCGIYKITNNINKKIYIGQSVDIERRWKEEKNNKDNSLIEQAIQQYGVKNFSFEIIEECNIKDLNEREIYWSKYYDSMNLNIGYNDAPCGQSYSYIENQKKVCQFDREGHYLQTFNSATDACKILKLNCPSHIRKACEGKKKTAYNYMWKYLNDWNGENIPPYKTLVGSKESNAKIAKKLGKPVLCIDVKTEKVIKEYPSAIEAERQLQVSYPNGSHVSHVCRGKRSTAYGYKWVYKENYQGE